ncbi:enoyl-CoA hydratase/isomerase family protein [Chloroflexota bacterium]
MAYQHVLYEKKESFAILTLNRPGRLNAIGPQMMREIMSALEEADSDDQVRVVIITGAGCCFSAGADFSPDIPSTRRAGAGREPQTLKWWTLYTLRRCRTIYFTIRDLSKPVIAAVHGYCLGAAFELAQACDMLVAADDAEFGAPEVRHGSILATALPFHVGVQKAKEMYLTGDRINAIEARRLGLVIHVVPTDKLQQEVFKLARRISRVPGEAVFFNKLQINIMLDDMGYMAGMRHASLVDAMCHYIVPETVTAFGVRLSELQQREGVEAYLKAREAPFPDDEKPFKDYDLT